MKLFKSFLLAIVVVTITACSSDDGPASVALTNESLAGTYEINFYEGSSETTVELNGSTVVAETETFVGDTFTDARVTFNANGTYTLSGSYVETYTVTITGMAPETDSEIVDFDEAGTFSVDNASRTITLDGSIVDVTLFDGTNLRLRGTYSETFGDFTESGQFEYRMTREN